MLEQKNDLNGGRKEFSNKVIIGAFAVSVLLVLAFIFARQFSPLVYLSATKPSIIGRIQEEGENYVVVRHDSPSTLPQITKVFWDSTTEILEAAQNNSDPFADSLSQQKLRSRGRRVSAAAIEPGIRVMVYSQSDLFRDPAIYDQTVSIQPGSSFAEAMQKYDPTPRMKAKYIVIINIP